MKKLLFGFSTVMLLLVGILVLRTINYTASEIPVTQSPLLKVDRLGVAQRMSQAIQFRTISTQPQLTETRTENNAQPDVQTRYEEFEAFIQWLAATYPEVHSQLKLERLGGYTLLFTWRGTDSELSPVLLSGHYDVVPVIPGTDELWTHPPFSGQIDQTHIWGRGALDDKSAVIALMEAATLLLAEDYQPKRTVYLSLTHDEERGGHYGTAAVVEKLKQENIQLAWSLDEGSFLLQDFVPGLPAPVASINVAEKGFMTLDLVARAKGGHSSMPPQETAVGILAAALLKLQQAPLPGGLEGLGAEMFDNVAPYMPFAQRLVFANRWLFGGLIDSVMSEMAATNAMLRTTTAPTMLSASVKENVLPIEAVGTVNFRLHPRDTLEGVVDYVTSVVNDERVEVRFRRGENASRVSSINAPGFEQIAEAARVTYGQIIVTPGLTVAGTDSRRYEQVADDAYRFNPMVVNAEDTAGFHGTNERISIDNMVNATRFYHSLIKRGASGHR